MTVSSEQESESEQDIGFLSTGWLQPQPSHLMNMPPTGLSVRSINRCLSDSLE